jgi:hypothetical protein
MRTCALLALAWVGCRSAPPLTIINGESQSVAEDGRRVVRLAPIGGNRKGSNVALAIADGNALDAATIDVDLKGNGEAQASFLGVAFGVADASRYEAVYFRPFNFRAGDAEHRGHAVQYVAWPEHTWEILRMRAPGVYEAAVAPVPDPAAWFHARIEVDAARVRVFVDGATTPCLVVDRLVPSGKGRVALWVDSQPGAFANLRVRRR